MMREVEIERQFDIKIESLKPNKGVYYLKTNKGNKCMKKIDYGVQKLVPTKTELIERKIRSAINTWFFVIIT